MVMTAAEAVDFLNVWGEAELRKAAADRSDPTDTPTTRSFRETVAARVASDPGFRVALQTEAAAEMRDALDALIVAAEQRAADDGEDDLIAATPELDAGRAAVASWDAANG